MKEDRSFGIVLVFREEEDLFLIVKHTAGHWGFPKGHKEAYENDQETALRELKEETGIVKCRIINMPTIHEEYIYSEGNIEIHKIVKYFVGFTEDKEVKLLESELVEYKWATYEEAMNTLSYDNNKEVLKEAVKYL
jgi:8-oxo-dGTP pyrophosphatase MutT (NUDIX family)